MNCKSARAAWLAARHGISLLNSPGTVDSDYRGEIKVILINLGAAPFTVRRGDRIAQMVLCPIPRIKLVPTAALPETERGKGVSAIPALTNEERWRCV